MACSIDSGYTLGCRDNTGGIQLAYIADFDPGQTYSYTVSGTFSGSIDTVTPSSSPSTYYPFYQEVEVGEFNQEGQYSTENGTVFFVQTLTLTMHKNDAALRSKLLLLSQGHLSVIVKDQRGGHWLMGKVNGCRVVTGTSNTGKAFGDLNGIVITIEGREPEPAHYIMTDAVTDFDGIDTV